MDLDRESPHIMSIVFLLSWGGCASRELGGRSPRLTLGEHSPPAGAVEVATRDVNGAYAIRLSLLDDGGNPLGEGWFVVDTGSPAPLTVGRSFGRGLKLRGGGGRERFVKQIGVNRESICSLVSPLVVARVTGGLDMATPLLINDVDSPGGADGYIGLGMLMRWRSVAFRRRADGGVSVHIDGGPTGGEMLRADTRLIEDAMRDSCADPPG